MVAIELVILFSRSGWNHEWDWALAQAAAGTLLLAPLVAGVVAFDRSRRVEPTLSLLAISAPRGARAVLALPVAAWLVSVAAWLSCVAVAMAIAWRGGASGRPDGFALVEPPILLLAASFVGFAVGSRTRSVLAGPGAAALVLLIRAFAGATSLHLEGLLSAGGSAGTLVAADRTPRMAVTLMVTHLTLAWLAIAVAVPRLREGARRRSAVVAALAGVTFLGSLTAYGTTASRLDPLRWTSSPQICSRGLATVCGPREGSFLLHVSQRSVSSALQRLRPSGIEWRTTYVLPHGPALDPDEGVLSAGPDQIHDGGLDTDAVVATLMNPRLCAALFDDRRAQPVLNDQTQVMEWLTTTLRSPGPVDAAPQSVRDAYRRRETCEPFTSRQP
jgi:hypothetical protein